MSQVCLYFQLHQPYRLGDFDIFDLDNQADYFHFQSPSGGKSNQEIFKKVASKSYLPMLQLLKKICLKNKKFKFAISCSGVFLDQAQEYEPKVLQLIKEIAETGQLEILAETYYHSLAFLYSPTEFKKQIKLHTEKIKKLFNLTPKVFRNTELIYANFIADLLPEFKFLGMLTEAVDRFLHGRPKTQVFVSQNQQLKMLLKHAQLSDDVAFRFSNKNWQWYPLTVDRYLEWLEIYPENEVVNLFMDFETFGEHQWADTGIFAFFEHLIDRFTAKPWNKFVTPSEVFTQTPFQNLPVYDVPELISWADVDRSITAWRDNSFQYDTLAKIYELEPTVLAKDDPEILSSWRKLQTSDHFYYMCTKWAADGDVHAYFNPYRSPFEAYRKYSIVLADLKQRLL